MSIVISKNKILILLLLAGFFMSSCDNTLEPVDEDLGLYAVYGFLDTDKAMNYIRVKDIKAPFTAEATENIDALVTLENTNANITEELIDVRSEYEGIYQHNFQVDDLQRDTEYRLRVEQSDGRSIELETKTPSKATYTISPATRDCETPVIVEFGNLNGGSIEVVIDTAVVKENPEKFLNFFEVFYTLSDGILYADDNNPTGALSYTFTPINYDLRGYTRDVCSDFPLNRLVMTVIHHSKGLREVILPDELDITNTNNRFGAFDIDTLEITF